MSYKCEICGAVFKCKDLFERHIKRHTTECSSILEIMLCPGDIVMVASGRFVVKGIVKSVYGSSIVILNDNHIVTVKKNKISMIKVLKRVGDTPG